MRPAKESRFVESATRPSLVRLSTAGSVDDGKSTLIGRLLHDTQNIFDDHLVTLKKRSAKLDDSGALALALVTDGLRAEEEQGITIDVAYRYFSTPRRRFILADTPGHEQYTRNMATGASTADLALILVDASKGVLIQTRRHAFIAALLGVPRFLVTVNKMDLVNFSENVFEKIREDFSEFAGKLGVKEVRFVPISALLGDNVAEASKRMPWYSGETVLSYLDNVYTAADGNQVDFRFPVQYVLRPNQNFRGYAGKIVSGSIKVGEEILVLPSRRKTKIKSIEFDNRSQGQSQLDSAAAPSSVVLTLNDEIDISRGDMLVRPLNVPEIKTHFEAMLVWLNEAPMQLKPYIIQHNTRSSRVFIEKVTYHIDVSTLSRNLTETPLQLNEIGRVSLVSTQALFLDPYQHNRGTGSFILVDPETNHTVAAGMVIGRFTEEALDKSSSTKPKNLLHQEHSLVTQAEREKRFGFEACTLWCTGLSGSGKSSLARALERRLFDLGRPVFRLDGDNMRSGLCQDLGFSESDRSENIRRTAEVAKLLNQAGVSVICSLISPLAGDRAAARKIIGAEKFVEIYLSAELSVCEARDPHGLYKKARAGELKQFTGITAPYEAPVAPELVIDTAKMSLDDSVAKVELYLKQR